MSDDGEPKLVGLYCNHCYAPLDDPHGLYRAAVLRWCGAECRSAYYEARPEEAANIVAVADMTPGELAQLHATLLRRPVALVPAQPRELHCEDCDRDYPTWVAPSELWNEVVRAPADAAGVTEPFLCLTCFALRAERHGIRPTAWVVRPEREDDMPRIETATDNQGEKR